MRALLLAGVVAFGWMGAAQANLLVNGDFETGDLSGYTVTDVNGSAGEAFGYPNVISFEVVQGQSSPAAEFRVGTATLFANGGASIGQTITTTAGLLSLSFDLASLGSGISANTDGGTFSLLLDGQSLNSFSVGFLGANSTVRDTLTASATVTAGQHTVSALIERLYTNGSVQNLIPIQYIDNFTVDVAGVTSVPEPAPLALLGIGAAGIVAARRRRAT